MPIECAECHAVVPDGTTECPDCGYAPRTRYRRVMWAFGSLGAVAGAAGVGASVAVVLWVAGGAVYLAGAQRTVAS